VGWYRRLGQALSLDGDHHRDPLDQLSRQIVLQSKESEKNESLTLVIKFATEKFICHLLDEMVGCKRAHGIGQGMLS